MKNCLLDAKNLVEELIQIDFSQNNNTSDSTCSGSSGSTKKPDIKNIMFHLKNYLSVDVFVEEFIQYEGIKYLVKAIEETTGNTRSYAINALKTLFEYVSSMEYLKENKELISALYEILVQSDNINTINYSLGILVYNPQ